MIQNPFPSEGFRFNVSSVLLDARDSKLAFSFSQEEEAMVSLLRKIDHPPIGEDTNNASELLQFSRVAVPMDTR